MAFWRMAFRAGNQGPSLWEDCKRRGVAAITYSPLCKTNLRRYGEGEPKARWDQLHSSQQASLRRVAYKMKVGDTIYVKEGTEIVGRGTVTAPYFFDARSCVDAGGYPWAHQLRVAWDADFPKTRILLGAEPLTVKELTPKDCARIEKAAAAVRARAGRDAEPAAARTYLLTWNSARSEWGGFARDVAAVQAGAAAATSRWSCGVSHKIRRGDRFYLLRQGPLRPGIVGSGVITRAAHEDRHWDDGRRKALYVGIRFDALVDPATDPRLPLGELRRTLRQYHWRPQASGTAVPEELVPELDRLWRERVGSVLDPDRAPDLSDDECSALEGAARRSLVLHRRREHRLRESKVQAFRREHSGRLYCEVDGCGFDFERVYGHLGREYAQVHHLKPLATGRSRKTGLRDLAVVCANCHVMIHRNGRSRTIAEISAAIKRRAR